MTCESMRCLVWDRIDGAIEARAQAALSDHLASCAGCAAYASRAERLHASLPRAFGATKVPDLAPEILARLPRPHSEANPFAAWIWPAAGVILAAVLWTIQTWGLATPREGLAVLDSMRSLLRWREWAGLGSGWETSLQHAIAWAGIVPLRWLAAAFAAALATTFADHFSSRINGDAGRQGHG
ncbi:MAG: zf-HC2 domain-containing protein [Elusimicrobia bacterium]|nr:zf-HC2 domain-containing protein [Elusimicrobiota bacterium]